MKLFEQRSTRRQFSSRLTAAAAGLLVPSFARLCAGEEPLIHIAICTTTIAGANISDARAAYLVWLREIARFYGKRTADTDPEVFISPDELIRGVRSGSIDGFGATALELEKLVDITEPDAVVIQDYMAGGMEYVLLVHNSSPFKKFADLRGAQLISHLHRDMVLMPAWLGNMLSANGLPEAERFFASQKQSDKINRVVLPVFFRRADAACLARHDWETAVELNPQLGRDLRTLAISPKLIPIGFFFRKNTNPGSRRALIQSIQSISSLTAGQEIIALYQSHSFLVTTLAAMNPTLDLVRQFIRFEGRHAGQWKGPA
jgi:ABC-type phosphate/phosphonate transport system substrate-binding protein